MSSDLREAVRQLRKTPGVTATAIVTLTLGIGATTAIFTLVHQVMLKSLPVVKPEELWRIGDKVRCCNWGGFAQGDDGDFSILARDLRAKRGLEGIRAQFDARGDAHGARAGSAAW